MNILPLLKPLLFLLVIVFPSIVKPISKAADDHDCPVQRCRHDGPDIKFPFRLQHYPLHCGHPDFEVSCSSFTNMTMMNLSSSSGFFPIQTIDYERHQFRVYDEDGCLPRRLLNFTLSFSLFQPANLIESCCSYYHYDNNLWNMTLLNCTQAQDLMYSFPISCLSVPGHYQILAVNENFTLNDLPVGSDCYTLSEFFLPVQKTQEDPCGCELDNGLFLEWREWDFPECQNSSNQIMYRYPTHIHSHIQKHKGHVSTRFIVIGVSVCGFVFLSTTAVGIFYHLKQSIKRREEKENQRRNLDDHKSHVPTRYSQERIYPI